MGREREWKNFGKWLRYIPKRLAKSRVILLNQLTGKFAEYQLLTEFRTKKRFSLSAYFDGVVDQNQLNIIDVRERFIFQRGDGKRIEIDLHAKSSDGRVVLVEVSPRLRGAKTQDPMGSRAIEEFQEKIEAYQKTPNGKSNTPTRSVQSRALVQRSRILIQRSRTPRLTRTALKGRCWSSI